MAPDMAPDMTPDMTPDMAPNVAPEMAPISDPNMAPISDPNMVPEMTPNVAPEMAPDMAPDMTPNMTPDMTPEVAPEVAPDMTPEVAPDMAPDMTPDMAPDMTPDMAPEMASPITGEDVPVTNVDVNTLPDTSVATEVLSEPSQPPNPVIEEPTNISGSEEQQQTSSETNISQEENTGAINEETNAEPEKINVSTSSQIDNDKLTQALDTIVEVLSGKVAAKVANEIGPGLSGEQIQNGFNSVADAAEKMSGGKKNKSKKFRLTNKTKSRKTKK